MRRKQIVSVMLIGAMVASIGAQANAGSLKEAQEKASDISDKKNAAQAEKESLAAELKDIVADIEETKKDLEKKQEEINEKSDELMKAQLDEDNQYEDMKLRIKFMYENGSGQLIETLCESQNFAEFLSSAEYITQLSEYDRDMLVEFQEIVTDVEEQKEALEEENKKLEKIQDSFISQQDELQVLIEEKSEEISALDDELGTVNKQIASLKAEAEKQARIKREAEAAALAAKAGGTPAAAANTQTTIEGTDDPDAPDSTVTPDNPEPAPEPEPDPEPSGGGSYGGGPLSNPCPSAWISSEFGGRESPGGIGSTNHKGRDYAASAGTSILAAAGGTVTTVSYIYYRGNYIQINHGGGLSTLYQHCSAIYASAGQSVSAGQVIAAVGSTGNSTGPHLHFEVWVNGVPVDPRLYL